MVETHKAYYSSDIGMIGIVGTEKGIISVEFVKDKSDGHEKVKADEEFSDNAEIHPCLRQCVRQLDEYFKGERKEFSLDLQLDGTDFQKAVWEQLMRIPFAETVSYKDIAEAIGNENAVRAVGGANGKNPISIIIPCHRVIAHDGSIGGFGGGIWRKEWLLRHERDVCLGE